MSHVGPYKPEKKMADSDCWDIECGLPRHLYHIDSAGLSKIRLIRGIE